MSPNPAGAQPIATLSNLEDWLIKITEYTGRTARVLEGRGASGQTQQRPQNESNMEKWLDQLGKRLTASLDRLIASLTATTTGLYRRGMQGTVEEARLHFAMDMLGRQVAAIFSPVTNALTYFAARLEPMMRSLSGNEQNRLMGAGVGAMLGYRFGGGLGALAGFAAGSGLLMGGENSRDTFMAAGAGAYLGFRTAGPVGALALGTAAAARAAPSRYESERPSDYYTRMRAGGATKLGAAFSTGAEAISSLFSNARPGAPPAARPPEPHRDVTPFMPQMTEAGSTFFRSQEAVIRATAGAGFEEAGPLKPIVDLMIEGLKLLAKLAGVELVERPASAERAR